MKVIVESFSSHYKRKEAEEVRYHKCPNFQINRPLLDRTLVSFIEAREKQKEKRSDRKKLLYFKRYISL